MVVGKLWIESGLTGIVLGSHPPEEKNLCVQVVLAS